MQCLNIPGEVGYGLFCFPECDCDTIPVPRCHLVWRPCLSPPLLVGFSFPFLSSLSLLLETLPNLIQSWWEDGWDGEDDGGGDDVELVGGRSGW